MSSFSWKHRFYAFLLRRALGPILTTRSAANLRSSIRDVDWSEGKVALVDVELDADYLTGLICKSADNDCEDETDSKLGPLRNIAVQKARIRQFSIHLSLCESVNGNQSGSTSTARQATSALLRNIFGSDMGESQSSIALVVHVELEGIDIEFAPSKRTNQSKPEKQHSSPSRITEQTNSTSTTLPEADQDAAAPPGFFSSLVDSALKSLRLSIDISDLKVRLFSQHCSNCDKLTEGNSNPEQIKPCWITLQLPSAKYYDLIESKNHTASANGKAEKLVLSKGMDWNGLVVETEQLDAASLPLLRSSGEGSVRFRAYEMWTRENLKDSESPTLSGRQEVDISLGNHVAADVDVCSLTRLITISNAGARLSSSENTDEVVDEEDEYEDVREYSTPKFVLADEFTRAAYDEVMKQYTEARHLARTRELRGGLLIPSFDEDDRAEGEISFDAFFDANDHSVGYYDSWIGENGNNSAGSNRRQHVHAMDTTVDFRLAEFTLNVHFGDSSQPTANQMPSEFIILSLGGLQFIVFSSAGESMKINCSISHFDIESQMLDPSSSGICVVNESILRFADHSECDSSSEILGSSPPCISVYVELPTTDNSSGVEKCCRVDLMLRPLEFIYRHRAVSCLTDLLVIANESKSQNLCTKETESSGNAVHASVSCGSLVVMMPFNANIAQSDALFARCGYKDAEQGATPFLGLGLELDNISVDFSNKSDEERKAVAKFRHAILFAKCTKLEGKRGRRRFAQSYVSRRTDLVACVADQDRASDSTIAVSYSKLSLQSGRQQINRKTAFPMILPLSSNRARQEDDDSDHGDDIFNDTVRSPGTIDRRNIKPTDPQYISSSEASEADSEIVVNIPCVFLDITLDERQDLISILAALSPQTNQPKINVNNICHPTETVHGSAKKEWNCVALNIGQLSIVLHGREQMYSYSLVCDSMQIYSLIDHLTGIRNVRTSLADATLYELSNAENLNQYFQNSTFPVSCADRCKRVQGRLVTKNYCLQSKAIFFRSKISQPLSPEFPAILIDLLIRKSSDYALFESIDGECDEKSIHVSVYDMTLRYYVGSEWIKNLTNLIKGENPGDEPTPAAGIDECPPSLTNLFVKLTDCYVDYTSPETYKTASRSVVRFGEIWLSSNLLAPAGRVQAYKVSLSDLGVHVCNFRHPYNKENSLLSCAHRHFNAENIYKKDSLPTGKDTVTIDGALNQMGFINVATIDSVDAVILVCPGDKINRRGTEPLVTATLTLGTIQCNFCKDSFSCTVDSFNDWLIKFTALSAEQLEKLRSMSESKSKIGTRDDLQPTASNEMFVLAPPDQLSKESEVSRNCRSGVPSLRQPESTMNQSKMIFRDDSASIDLTKSLLFQNYYTFDAKNSCQNPNPVQKVQPIAVVESPSSDDDDEWAAVEHEYLRHTTLSRENDQRAEWVICHTDEKENGESSESRSKTTVKVYPQHIPNKPAVGHLGRAPEGVAKLTGAHLAAQIGLRLIVNDASVVCRFFDGLDWVKLPPKKPTNDRKKILLSGLLKEDEEPSHHTFTPLPDERGESIEHATAQKKLRRNVHRYFSMTIGGLKLNQDSYLDSPEHRLASCLHLSVADFFIAETISNKDPVKMIGEWINEVEHPRDNSDGVIMLKMITDHPVLRVSADGKLMSDESGATLELLPLRCDFHQTAIRFIRSFFSEEAPATGDKNGDTDGNNYCEEEIIPVFFTSFHVAPSKLKVDYTPEKFEVDSFREGNYVEILNLCPLEDMVLTLQAVENQDLLGWGSAFGELASRWIDDICASQSHKFFTRSTPVQFFSSVTEGVADLAMVLVVPESGSFADYLKDVLYSTTTFASKLACETLNTSAKITRFAANQLNTKALPPASFSPLPSRPKAVPRHVGDAAGHGYESISRGLREANYKIVTVPLREYQQSGASGAARSAVKGIPIAVLAPLSGVSEALSYTLLGLRNSLRPDLRKEQEASLRGLHFD